MYSPGVKYQAVQMKLAGKPMKEIMKELGIKNESQVKTWVRWFRNWETYLGTFENITISNLLFTIIKFLRGL